MKTRFVLSCIISSLILFFSARHLLQGKEQVIKYLPRNEKVDIVSRNLGITLGETACSAAEDLFTKAALCNYCVNTLKEACPDCCLVFAPVRAIRCSPEANLQFPCKDVAFPSSSCPGISDQHEGCGDPTPLTGGGEDPCVKDGTYAWICEKNNLTSTFKGCTPSPDAQSSGVSNCSGFSPIYNIEDNVVCPGGGAGGGGGGGGGGGAAPATCYRYTLKANYESCLDTCNDYVDDQSACSQSYINCKKEVCGGDGFDARCKNSPDLETGKGKCDERLEWPECDSLTVTDCVRMNNEATSCLTDSDGKCYSCFRPIHGDFFYRFVARSREKLIITWLITSTPKFEGEAPVYFYTMVKIIDENSGEEVHKSIVNQKSFQGSFSIYSATAQSSVREGDNKIILETGRPYRAVLCYFIPPVNMGLNIQIDKVQMIAVRTRN